MMFLLSLSIQITTKTFSIYISICVNNIYSHKHQLSFMNRQLAGSILRKAVFDIYKFLLLFVFNMDFIRKPSYLEPIFQHAEDLPLGEHHQ